MVLNLRSRLTRVSSFRSDWLRKQSNTSTTPEKQVVAADIRTKQRKESFQAKQQPALQEQPQSAQRKQIQQQRHQYGIGRSHSSRFTLNPKGILERTRSKKLLHPVVVESRSNDLRRTQSTCNIHYNHDGDMNTRPAKRREVVAVRFDLSRNVEYAAAATTAGLTRAQCKQLCWYSRTECRQFRDAAMQLARRYQYQEQYSSSSSPFMTFLAVEKAYEFCHHYGKQKTTSNSLHPIVSCMVEEKHHGDNKDIDYAQHGYDQDDSFSSLSEADRLELVEWAQMIPARIGLEKLGLRRLAEDCLARRLHMLHMWKQLDLDEQGLNPDQSQRHHHDHRAESIRRISLQFSLPAQRFAYCLAKAQELALKDASELECGSDDDPDFSSSSSSTAFSI